MIHANRIFPLGLLAWLCCFVLAPASLAQTKTPTVVQVYSQEQLLALIRKNQHLQQVKADDCQLLQDIEARAVTVKLPSYQFLFGDMLAYGVCLERDVPRGMSYMKKAAEQGLAEALEQLGRYYHIGRFVQTDINQALIYLRQASSLDNTNAKLRFAQLLVDGHGSPYDYQQAYAWLHHSIMADRKQHKQAQQLLQQLAQLMPAKVVQRAKQQN